MPTMHYRIDAIDVLRGLVMLLMALDHTRDFLTAGSFDPRDFNQPVLFMTRWVTHICAPTFVFLVGLSLVLWQSRRTKTKNHTAAYVFSRGIWLIFLEFTLVRMGWTFSLSPDFMFMQVIWVIGVSMVVLSGLIFLPLRVIAIFSLFLIVGHNLLDAIQPDSFGNLGWIWRILHAPSFIYPWEGVKLFALYPIIPWVGVMSLGYFMGSLLVQKPTRRKKWWFALGGASLVAFAILRAVNIYGDPVPWNVQEGFLQTTLAFINCEKYPPSLLYLLMTLGISWLFLAFFDGKDNVVTRILKKFGRVPLFFYLIHIPIIHVIALIMAYLSGVESTWLFYEPFFSKPEEYGFSLAVVYIVWGLLVAALYLPCKWFGIFKRRWKKQWWASYL